MLKLNLDHLHGLPKFTDYQEKINRVHQMLINKSGAGSDFLGWYRYPDSFDHEEVKRIKVAAQYIQSNFEVLVVCGIGGSYLGARAAIEALQGLYPKRNLEIIYMGQTFSPTYLKQVMHYLSQKKFAINVISKSGTTTETSIAFRLLREALAKKLSLAEIQKAIYVTTDKEKGALLSLAKKEGYETFTLPDDIGGRYSVLTPVGLLPIAAAGINIDALLDGARAAMIDYSTLDLSKNLAYQYAITRFHLFKSKSVDLFVSYEPHFAMLAEWFKQLFGESEGKLKKGLFPSSVSFSTDLHSLGQFIQDGSPILFETILNVEKSQEEIYVPLMANDSDELNYLAGRPLSFVNEKAFLGTLKAHSESGEVPCLIVSIPKMDEYHLGYLFYFFMLGCAASAYLLNINPFNQPGVEVYKRNMFHLLGKKGF